MPPDDGGCQRPRPDRWSCRRSVRDVARAFTAHRPQADRCGAVSDRQPPAAATPGAPCATARADELAERRAGAGTRPTGKWRTPAVRVTVASRCHKCPASFRARTQRSVLADSALNTVGWSTQADLDAWSAQELASRRAASMNPSSACTRSRWPVAVSVPLLARSCPGKPPENRLNSAGPALRCRHGFVINCPLSGFAGQSPRAGHGARRQRHERSLEPECR